MEDRGFKDLENWLSVFINRTDDRCFKEGVLNQWKDYMQDRYNLDIEVKNIISKKDNKEHSIFI